MSCRAVKEAKRSHGSQLLPAAALEPAQEHHELSLDTALLKEALFCQNLDYRYTCKLIHSLHSLSRDLMSLH